MARSTIGASLAAHNAEITQTKAANSVHDHIEKVSGQLVTNTFTLDGNGAQTDNIFQVTGAVDIVSLLGECTEATDATTCTGASWTLYDGSATIDITESATGTSLSGIGVGGMIYKDATAGTALTYDNNAAGVFNDGGGEGYFTTLCPFRVTAKTGVATYIRFNFTGDANTDIDVKFKIRYVNHSDDGVITAV